MGCVVGCVYVVVVTAGTAAAVVVVVDVPLCTGCIVFYNRCCSSCIFPRLPAVQAMQSRSPQLVFGVGS